VFKDKLAKLFKRAAIHSVHALENTRRYTSNKAIEAKSMPGKIWTTRNTLVHQNAKNVNPSRALDAAAMTCCADKNVVRVRHRVAQSGERRVSS
jgi:hypothetical protein